MTTECGNLFCRHGEAVAGGKLCLACWKGLETIMEY